jgi:hypothetical protein
MLTGVVTLAPVMAAPGQSLTLQVKSLIQSVPADGQSHAVIVISLQSLTGQSMIAPATFSVLLSSSNVGAGSVKDMVKFPAGKTFVLANFTSTTAPGATTITASAEGFQSGATQVQTLRLSGYPTSILVYMAPSRAVAQTSYTGRIILELVDSRGSPAPAPNDTVITLSSSNVLVGTPSGSTVTIPQGSAVGSGFYQTGLQVGATTISASAAGLVGGSALVTVVGSTPAQLRALASTNPAPPNTNQVLAVWLLDQSGNPTQAPRDISISISNSNTSEVTVPSSATIRAGSSYVDVPFRTWTSTGLPAKLTIESLNLTTTSVEMSVVNPSAQPGEMSLKLNFAPQAVVANGHAFKAVFVDLMKNGRPAVASTGVTIALVSNNYGVMSVNGSVTLNPGYSYALATLQTSYRVGTAQITATATNVISDQEQISSFGQSPNMLSLALAPGILPATGETFPALTIGLEASNGLPANTPANATVRVVSSNQKVLPINTTVTIPEGYSSILVPLTTTASPGLASITVSGSGYSSATTTVSTTVPGPSGLRLSLSPQPGIETPLNPVAMMGLQLLDSSGNPVQTTVPVQVTLTASNSTVLSSPLLEMFQVGSDFQLIPFQVNESGSTQLTATSPGLLPSSVSVSFLAYPLVTGITGSTAETLVNSTMTVTFSASVQGVPLQNASVAWSSNIGTLTPSNTTTNANGSATTSFTSRVVGGADILGTLLIPGLKPVVQTWHVDALSSFPSNTNSGFLGLDLRTVILAVAVAVVILLAVSVAFGLFRRKQPGTRK